MEIIYEDENVLVINKPAGLVVHSDGKTEESTVCDWVMENYPDMENVGEPIDTGEQIIKRPGIVHRLDRETSGVMVLAKNQESFLHLKDQFKDRKITKKYNCIVWGNIKNDEGVVDVPIGRSGKDFRQWSAQRGARGKMRDAVTEYKVLSRFEDRGEKFVFLEVFPKTGRTHQIRVHMKYLGNPLVCDSLYNPNRPSVLGFDRLALHSREISLDVPDKGRMTFEAPYPEDFIGVLANL